MDWNDEVSHSYEKANRCANALANIEYSLDYNSKIYETCPTKIRHLLLIDIMRIAIPSIFLWSSSLFLRLGPHFYIKKWFELSFLSKERLKL